MIYKRLMNLSHFEPTKRGVMSVIMSLMFIFSAIPHLNSAVSDKNIKDRNRENIVQLDEKIGRLEVKMFLNKLFLPHSTVLRDDAYIILDHIISRMKLQPQRRVIFKAFDTPHRITNPLEPDLATQRCTVIFSYLLYTTLDS